MEKINQVIDWVKGYQMWEMKDYAKAAAVVVIAIAILVSIF